MFDNEEDEDEDFERSEFDMWYDDNNWSFRRGADAFVEPGLEEELFYQNVYCPIMEELAPAIRKLLVQQYPVIGTEHRHSVLNAMERYVNKTGHALLLQLYDLMKDQVEGVDLRKKNPDFEKWENSKKESNYISRGIFDKVEGLTAKQKEELYKLVKEEFQDSYNYKDQILYEFIEIVQPLIFKHYPLVQELDSDGWIVYYHLMCIEHMDYRLDFEHYVTFIEYEFPEEDLHIPYKEFQEKFQKKFDERRKKEQDEREKGNNDQ